MQKQKQIASAIKRVEGRDGRITAEAVVAAARDKKSVLHDQFEWDDTKAGHQYRLDQARALIRSVSVVFQTEDRTIRTVAYVRDPEADTEAQGYRSVAKLRSESEEARSAVVAEFARASSHLRRARDLAVVLGSADAIADLIKQVSQVERRIQAEAGSA